MIEIDGTTGGGQILRTALGLSVLTKEAFRIKNIRKNRPVSGLRPQHLACVNIMKEICNAYVEGNKEGSGSIEFIPREMVSRKIDVDIGTAGSVTLVLQSLLIPYIFADKSLTIKLIGGTDVKWSPPVDYYRTIILNHLRNYCKIEFSVQRRGYYPKGGGMVELKLRPRLRYEHSALLSQGIGFKETEQGKLELIKGIVHVSSDLAEKGIMERMIMSAKNELRSLGCDIHIDKVSGKTESSGAGITLWAVFSRDDSAVFLGSDCLSEKGKKAEDVGKKAAKALIEEVKSHAPVDSHCADNLIPYLAIFGGKIKVSKITEHTRTNMKIAELFLGGQFNTSENTIQYHPN